MKASASKLAWRWLLSRLGAWLLEVGLAAIREVLKELFQRSMKQLLELLLGWFNQGETWLRQWRETNREAKECECGGEPDLIG
jgi:hypothetical protein